MFEKLKEEYYIESEINPSVHFTSIIMQPRVNYLTQNHHHRLRIAYIKEGYGEYVIDGHYYDISPGDIFVFNNMERHNIRTVYAPNPLRYINLHFEPRFIWANQCHFLSSHYLDIFFKRNSSFKNRLPRDNPALKQVQTLMLEIEEEFKSKPAEYGSMIKVKLLHLLTLIVRYFNTSTEQQRKPPTPLERNLVALHQVMEYIHSNLDRKITLEDLAEVAHLNPSYFSTLFKRYNGLAPSQYITRMRVERSLGLLKDPGMTVLEVAGSCGFDSMANFYKAFKSVTGRVPSDYRAAFLQP